MSGAEAQTEIKKDDATLRQVQSQYVCMVNDTHFDEKQIPIPIKDKTYYGCCQGCVNRLNKDSTIRYSIDPVSRDTVDKATAIIGVDQEGQAYYFESQAHLRAFDPDDPGSEQDSQKSSH